jgi:hypothetical protein
MRVPQRFSQKHRDGSVVTWLSPTSLADLTALQSEYSAAAPGTVKYVCANTSYGVEKYFNGTGYPTPYSVCDFDFLLTALFPLCVVHTLLSQTHTRISLYSVRSRGSAFLVRNAADFVCTHALSFVWTSIFRCILTLLEFRTFLSPLPLLRV